MQLILFPLAQRWGTDEDFWHRLSGQEKQRILRYLVARYAAYPQVFWLVVYDCHYGERFPRNTAFVREAGSYLWKHDPWQHPRSTGPNRNAGFLFSEEEWATYIHLEDEHDLSATEFKKFEKFGKPIFLGEDRYEQDHGRDRDPSDMRYWQRRLFWSWLLSGGSANYGGRWLSVHPYRQTGKREFFVDIRKLRFGQQLTGLDSVIHISRFLGSNNIELCSFQADDSLVQDSKIKHGIDAPKLARRQFKEFLVYHPSAKGTGQHATRNRDYTAAVSIDLRKASGDLTVQWLRCHDGTIREAPAISGRGVRELTAPWSGEDVVLRLIESQ